MGGTSIDLKEARRRLLAWYGRRRRELPWRRTRDPYPVWVSEVMLQQTRVAAAIPYFERFLRRFPDVATLARARLDTVLTLWSGLGYYRRARMLHAAAGIVAREGFPETAAEWRRLPGVGEYTAAAVASIAFGESAAVVDGNVERVICRLWAMDRDRQAVRERAQAWISSRVPGKHNQAVMELGATVCKPRAPDCGRCPLRDHCRGRRAPERYPSPRERPAPVVVVRPLALVTRNGRVLLRRRSNRGPLEGLWDLPAGRRRGAPLATVRHGIMDTTYVLQVYEGGARGGGSWFDARRLERIPLATGARKCLRSLGFLKAGRTTSRGPVARKRTS